MTRISDLQVPYIIPEQDLIATYDHRWFPRRITDLALSFFRQFQYFFALAFYRLILKTPSDQTPSWKKNSEGLVVMIHGLNNHPAQWHSQIQLMQKEQGIDIYAPSVKHRGSCSLTESAPSLLNPILDYMRKHPGKPICLLGVSNGARLTTWIETQLRKRALRTPVKISNIAGAHYGSSLLNRLWWISWLIVPKAVREELSYGSDCAKKIITEAQKPLPWFHGARDFEYYATTEDLVIPTLNSTLPKIGKKTNFHILHGHSHDSIVSAVAKKQIESCVSWIHEQNHTWIGRLIAYLW